MVIYEKKRFLSRMDNMGTEMYNLSLILNLSKWASGGRVDSTAKWSETMLSASTLTICPSYGCTRHVHVSSMFAPHAQRLLDKELPRGYPLVIIHRQYHIFHGGSVEEAKNLSTLLDLLVDLSGLQINRAKLAFMGFGLTQEESLKCSEALGTPIGSLPIR